VGVDEAGMDVVFIPLSPPIAAAAAVMAVVVAGVPFLGLPHAASGVGVGEREGGRGAGGRAACGGAGLLQLL